MYDKSETFKKSVKLSKSKFLSIILVIISKLFYWKKTKDKDTGCYKVFTVFVV